MHHTICTERANTDVKLQAATVIADAYLRLRTADTYADADFRI